MNLLYIEPRCAGTTLPVVDMATRRMAAAFRRAAALKDFAYCGFHTCVCGATSKSYDFELPDGSLTNSLCVHYLAFHRDEVPPRQLEEVERLPYGEAEPTAEELQYRVQLPDPQPRSLGLASTPLLHSADFNPGRRSMADADALQDYDRFEFNDGRWTRPVYRRGSGPR